MADQLEKAWNAGFKHALNWYGIWKDGTQTIGCKNTPIKDATPMLGQMEHDIYNIVNPENINEG